MQYGLGVLFWVCVLSIAYFVQRQKKWNGRRAYLQDCATNSLARGDPLGALMMACEMSGMKDEYHAHYLRAQALEELGKYRLAAEAYREARMRLYSAHLVNTEPWVISLLYREAYALSRCMVWEFAYKRSNEAVKMIATHPSLRFNNGDDLEAEIRKVRMFASLSYFKGSTAFEKATKDAMWLMGNATNVAQIEVGRAVLAVCDSLVPLTCEVMAGLYQMERELN